MGSHHAGAMTPYMESAAVVVAVCLCAVEVRSGDFEEACRLDVDVITFAGVPGQPVACLQNPRRDIEMQLFETAKSDGKYA